MYINEKSKVTIVGEICENFEYSHKVYGEYLFTSKVKIERMSGIFDFIPFTVSDRIIDVKADWNGICVEITGEFRSYNRHTDNGNRLILSVFAREIKQLENIVYNDNSIELDGYVCKAPAYRQTPKGREITEIILAVNRPYGKSDYIPCIAWGRNARFAGSLDVGTRLKLEGRIQSREYYKRISDTETETRTAYEVSVSKLEVVED